MVKSVALRLVRMVAVLWLVSIATFALVASLPGDPARLIVGPQGTNAQVAYIRAQMGLDRPLITRYLDWIHGVVTLNFGKTLQAPIEPVNQVISHSLPITLQIASMAIVLGLVGGVWLGALAASRPESRLDRAITGGSFALVSLPAFVLALIMIRLFVFENGASRLVVLAAGVVWSASLLAAPLLRRDSERSWRLGSVVLRLVPMLVGFGLFMVLEKPLPREGWVSPEDSIGQNLLHAALPALVLAFGLIPLYAQLLRADMSQTLRQNFITIARAKGMTERHVIMKEALRPSLFSLITVAAISFGNLIGGSVIVETVFNIPGLGSTLVDNVISKDFAVVQVAVLIVAAIFLALNTFVDIAYQFLDPRLRRAGH
jgi:peptide/nickel transport system permease protein